MTDYG